MIVSIVLALSCLQSVASYRFYQAEIPNGAIIPVPCKPGEKWEGVGHHNDQGTGSRNPFGLDFAAAGHTWSTTLCRKDSDGDGMINGVEVGDPDCVWKKGDTPKTNVSLSHPGICDPWDSPKCMAMPMTQSVYPTQKEWMAEECKSGGLKCPALNETGIKTITLRLPAGSRVPPKETTYECQIFDLRTLGMSADLDFHMVAVTPLVENKDVLHHIVLSACTEGVSATPGPYECGMVAHENCQEYIHVWTVGLAGECYHPLSGIRIGKTGVKVVAMQLHWNNPAQRTTYTDSSGLLVHYTANLRPFDAGVIMIGGAGFVLPPKKPELTVVSTCSSSCTSSMMNDTVNVTSAWNHMHYAGNKMSIEVWRDNQFVQYLTNDKVYSYDSPQVQLYPDPFQLRPGDKIISKCGYTTINRNRSTFFGEATNDEMCFGFLTYYPRRNIRSPYCIDHHNGISYCDQTTFGGCTRLGQFVNSINTTDVFRDVSEMCKPLSPCLEECRDTILMYTKKEKCMQGNIWEYIQDEMAGREEGKHFLNLLYSCKVEVYVAMGNVPQVIPGSSYTTAAWNFGQPSSAAGPFGSIVLLAVTMATSLMWTE